MQLSSREEQLNLQAQSLSERDKAVNGKQQQVPPPLFSPPFLSHTHTCGCVVTLTMSSTCGGETENAWQLAQHQQGLRAQEEGLARQRAALLQEQEALDKKNAALKKRENELAQREAKLERMQVMWAAEGLGLGGSRG